MTPAWFSAVAAAVLTAFSVCTSLYCVLAWTPFTYHQLQQAALFPSVARFSETHHWSNLAVFLFAIPVPARALLRRGLGGGRRLVAGGLLLAWPAWTIFLLWNPLLPRLANHVSSYLWAFVPLLLAGGMAVLAVLDSSEGHGWPEEPSRTGGLFAAALLASIWAPAVSGTAAHWRRGDLSLSTWAESYVWSASVQAMLFAGAFLLLHWCATLSTFTRTPARSEFVLAHAAVSAAVTAMLGTAVFRPLGFQGPACWFYSTVLALVLSSAHASLALLLCRGRARSGFEAAFGPWILGRCGSAATALVCTLGAAALCGAALIGPRRWTGTTSCRSSCPRFSGRPHSARPSDSCTGGCHPRPAGCRF